MQSKLNKIAKDTDFFLKGFIKKHELVMAAYQAVVASCTSVNIRAAAKRVGYVYDNTDNGIIDFSDDNIVHVSNTPFIPPPYSNYSH